MSYIKTRANKLSQQLLISGRSLKHQDIISKVDTELYNIDSDSDKVILLTTILEDNQTKYDHHIPNCTNPENCQTNYEHESITYFLTQKLNRLGVKTDNDQFTSDEIKIVTSTLESIKNDLQTIKNGQEIIFEEIESLKEHFILGKKTWSQLFIGKITDMTVSGIVSETLSKDIISKIKNIDFSRLLTT